MMWFSLLFLIFLCAEMLSVLKRNFVKGEKKATLNVFFTSSLKMLLAWLLLSAAFSAEPRYITLNKWKMNRGLISHFS